MHKTDMEFPVETGTRRKPQTGLGSRWELDSGMHRSESGSGLQAEQEAAMDEESETLLIPQL